MSTPMATSEKYDWQFTLLNGKIPVVKNWPNRPATMAELEAHPGNIGLITGSLSGIDVLDFDIDEDTGKLPQESGAMIASLPETPMVRTGRGGIHVYFKHADGVGNSAGKLGERIDVRGDGGQVVFPSSIHPDTKKPYEWMVGCSPDDVPVATWPKRLLDRLLAKPVPKPPRPTPVSAVAVQASGASSPYGSKALANECDNVRTAPKGTRNDALNKAACKLGSLMAGGQLDEPSATYELISAAKDAGLTEQEIATTLKSGLAAGMKTPRVLETYTIASRTINDGAEAIPDPPPDEWPEPTPLAVTLKPVPVIDPALLPGSLAPWLVDVAERMQAPLEFGAVNAMVMLGAVLGRKLAIRPRRRDNWEVFANLWGVTIGQPSSKKSPSQNAIRKPLDQIEAEAGEEYAAAMKDWTRKSTVLKLQKKATSDAIKTALKLGDAAEAERISYGSEEQPDPPVRRRLVTSDATVEKLAMLVEENPNGMLVVRDELVGWLKDMDKSGRESSRAFFLEAWAGDGIAIVDRVSRPSVFVDGLCLSVLGCCVPGTFGSYVSEALEDGRGADGLLQRFQLAVWPDPSPEWQDVDRWPNQTARTDAGECFKRLHALTPREVGAETDRFSGIPFLRFTEEAQNAWNEWYKDVENRARKCAFTAWQSYLGKLPKAVAGLALLCHLIDKGTGSVSLAATTRALAWAEFLEGHAQRIYLSGAARQTAAQILLAHIKAGDVVDGDTLRDVQRHEWSQLKTAEAVKEAAEDLVKAGCIRVSKQSTGGAPANTIAVNPKLEVVHDEDEVAGQTEEYKLGDHESCCQN